MIILCGGMYRSGSTLQYNLVANLVENKQLGSRVPYRDYQSDPDAFISGMDLNQLQYQILKIHELPAAAMPLIREKSAKCLSAYRDIRDVVASWQAKTKVRFSISSGLEFARGAIKAFQKWEEAGHADCLILKYEDTIKDVPSACLQIADFLNLAVSQTQVSEICHQCSVETISERLKNLKDYELMRSSGMAWDSHTLVHLDHLNGGIVGRARKELDEGLLFALEDEFGEWLVTHGYVAKLANPNLPNSAW